MIPLLMLTEWNNALSQDSRAGEALLKDIKEVCTQPATQGAHWTVNADGGGQLAISVKALSEAGLSGRLQFSKEEWSGIQRVLAADQVSDNDSYRKCVETLTPLFLPKVQTESASRHDKALALADQYDASLREAASAFHFATWSAAARSSECQGLELRLEQITSTPRSLRASLTRYPPDTDPKMQDEVDARLKKSYQVTLQSVNGILSQAERAGCGA